MRHWDWGDIGQKAIFVIAVLMIIAALLIEGRQALYCYQHTGQFSCTVVVNANEAK